MTEKEVINVMNEFAALGLTQLKLKNNGTELVLKKNFIDADKKALADQDTKNTLYNDKEAPQLTSVLTLGANSPSQTEDYLIKAPLVGVFYEASSPEETPFVKVGQKVSIGDTVALIEAMKMMNEVKSPVNGTVSRISATNGEMVEFDEVLMEIAKE